ARGEQHGPDAAEQVEQGEETRHHDDDAAQRQWRRSHAYSARTVPPTRTRSPGLTLTTGRSERGRKTSVREPNRMRPRRSPWMTRSPGFECVTRRPAVKP